jgi:hypothetical protein
MTSIRVMKAVDFNAETTASPAENFGDEMPLLKNET